MRLMKCDENARSKHIRIKFDLKECACGAGTRASETGSCVVLF